MFCPCILKGNMTNNHLIWNLPKACFMNFIWNGPLNNLVNLMTLTCVSWDECQHGLYFMGQWFWLVSWNTIWFPGIMSQCGVSFDLNINAGHSDQYFTVQWFARVFWKLFYGWTSSFEITSQWHKDWPHNKYRSHWHILWSCDFVS